MKDNKKPTDKNNETPEATKEGNEAKDELEQVLSSISPEQRKIIEKMMVPSAQANSPSLPQEAEMIKKITPEYISNFLDAQQERQNSYAERLYKKVFIFLTIIVAMIFFVVVIILLREVPNTMENVICVVCGALGGALAGYGFGKNQK